MDFSSLYKKNFMFRRILRDCLDISDQHVLILGDKGIGENQAAPFLTENFTDACLAEGIAHSTYIQSAKKRGDLADKTLVKGLLNLPKRSAVIVNMSNRIGRIPELEFSFRAFMKNKKHRFISATSLGTVLPKHLPTYLEAMDIDYKKAQRQCERVKKLLDDASEAHVSSKAGTDLVFGLEHMSGRVASGLYHEDGHGGNLPGYETYIAPYKKKVDGVAVIDGSSRVKETTNLITSDEGIRMEIQNGSIVSMNASSEAKELQKTLQWAERKAEQTWGIRRIGELGIGLNPKAKIIGAMILDEKARGTAHIAIGSNKWFGGNITSIIHLDQVMRDAKIKIDSRTLRV